MLAQSGFQVRMVAKGIVFPFQKLIQIRLIQARIPYDYCVGNDISQPLGPTVDKAGKAADQIKDRQTVDNSKKIANDNLAKLQMQPVDITDPQAQQSFPERLPAPVPFQCDPISD
jgi:hypothetical protein